MMTPTRQGTPTRRRGASPTKHNGARGEAQALRLRSSARPPMSTHRHSPPAGACRRSLLFVISAIDGTRRRTDLRGPTRAMNLLVVEDDPVMGKSLSKGFAEA